MNPSRRPLVAYRIGIYENEDGPEYCVYTDAYGLEMTIDDEFPVDTILLAPPELVGVITTQTGATEMGTVFAGASSPPEHCDFKGLLGAGATWILLRPSDNIGAAVAAGLHVMLTVDADFDVSAAFAGVSVEAERLALSISLPDGADPAAAQAAAHAIRESLRQFGCGGSRIVLGADVGSDRILEFMAEDDIDGVYLGESDYGTAVELVATIAEA